MVLLRGKTARTPIEVWTGSTNLTDGGIYGQANVGHRVRDERTAAQFLDVLDAPRQRPRRAATDATKDPLNIEFLQEVGSAHARRRPSSATIPAGITPLFSPRTDMTPLDLYVQLLAKAKSTVVRHLRVRHPLDVQQGDRRQQPRADRCASSCSRRRTQPRPTKAHPGPVVRLNSQEQHLQGCRLGAAHHARPMGRGDQQHGRSGSTSTSPSSTCKFMLHDPLGPDPIVVTGSANFS